MRNVCHSQLEHVQVISSVVSYYIDGVEIVPVPFHGGWEWWPVPYEVDRDIAEQ